jgi:predicted nucleotidyltransferase
MIVDPADLARELVRRRKVEREGTQRHAQKLRLAVASEVAAIVADRWARRAWLIGSLAWGTFGERSDVDIAFEGLAIDRIGAVASRLGDCLRVGVDVLRLEDLSGGFRDRVLEEGIELVA